MKIVNPFSKAHQAHTADARAAKRAAKYEPVPFEVEMAVFNTITRIGGGFINVISALLAASFVVMLASNLGAPNWLSWAFGLMAAALVEMARRTISEKAFDSIFTHSPDNPKPLALLWGAFLIISAASITMSYVGGDHQGKVLAANRIEADTTTNTNTVDYASQIAVIDDQLKGMRNKQGQYYHKHASSVAALQAQRTQLTELDALQTQRGYASEDADAAEVTKAGLWVGGVSLACELIFCLCAWFGAYYDYRSHVERVDTADASGDASGDASAQTRRRPERARTRPKPKPDAAPDASLRPAGIGFRRNDERTDETTRHRGGDALQMSANCANCGARFTRRAKHHKYCSDNCRKAAHEAK